MRWIYFVLHFVIGFFALWLSYTYAKISFLHDTNNVSLWLQGFVETTYLVLGVVWGSIGWDTFTRRIPPDSRPSLVVYALSQTLAPVAILLPVVFNAIELSGQGFATWKTTSLVWQNCLLWIMSLLLIMILMRYRKTEMPSFYRYHGV